MYNHVRHYPVNRKGRTFVAGDLHGCLRQLMLILAAINFDFDNDILYQNGDQIDRGPTPIDCLLLNEKPWFRGVAGNHEGLLIDAMRYPGFDWEHWRKHGGGWALETPRTELAELAKLAARLPAVIVVGEGTERFNVFHAEFHGSDAKLDALNERQWVPLNLQLGDELIKGKVKPEIHAGLSPSFVGHRIVKKPRIIGSHVYIDTGSFLGELPHDTEHGVTVLEPATQKAWQYKNGKVVQTL